MVNTKRRFKRTFNSSSVLHDAKRLLPGTLSPSCVGGWYTGLYRFIFVEDQAIALRIDIEAEDGRAARPFALASRRRHLVARPLGDDLTLELREGQQDVENEPSHRIGRIELLRYG